MRTFALVKVNRIALRAVGAAILLGVGGLAPSAAGDWLVSPSDTSDVTLFTTRANAFVADGFAEASGWLVGDRETNTNRDEFLYRPVAEFDVRDPALRAAIAGAPDDGGVFVEFFGADDRRAELFTPRLGRVGSAFRDGTVTLEDYGIGPARSPVVEPEGTHVFDVTDFAKQDAVAGGFTSYVMTSGLIFGVQNGVSDQLEFAGVRLRIVGSGIDGDYDDSGIVEQSDLNLVLSNWGQDAPFTPNGVPFATATVDQEELNRVLTNWGATAAPSFTGFDVPEPGLGLAVLLGITGLRARRRPISLSVSAKTR